MKKLEDKVAIVTGGAQGIGEAIVRAFAGEGAHVVIADILVDKAEALGKIVNATVIPLGEAPATSTPARRASTSSIRTASSKARAPMNDVTRTRVADVGDGPERRDGARRTEPRPIRARIAVLRSR